MSQQIRLLENYLECNLFDRHSKQTTLSAKGQVFLPYIENAFEQIRSGVNTITLEPQNSDLKITALHSVTSIILLPNIDYFQQSNPELSVQFSPNNKLDNFHGGELDIAIRRGAGNYDGLESHKLVDDEIILVACAHILPMNTSDIKEIFKIPLLEDTSSDIQEAISDCCTKFSIKRAQLKSKLKTTDAQPVIQYALAGQGLAFVSRILVTEHLKTGLLTNVLDYAYNSPKTLYLVAPSHHFSWQKVKLFEQWLRSLLIPVNEL